MKWDSSKEDLSFFNWKSGSSLTDDEHDLLSGVSNIITPLESITNPAFSYFAGIPGQDTTSTTSETTHTSSTKTEKISFSKSKANPKSASRHPAFLKRTSNLWNHALCTIPPLIPMSTKLPISSRSAGRTRGGTYDFLQLLSQHLSFCCFVLPPLHLVVSIVYYLCIDLDDRLTGSSFVV